MFIQKPTHVPEELAIGTGFGTSMVHGGSKCPNCTLLLLLSGTVGHSRSIFKLRGYAETDTHTLGEKCNARIDVAGVVAPCNEAN